MEFGHPEADLPGTVYLVGAGPGDPELLTVRAERLLRRCDALVYDSLVPAALLELVPAQCERRFVGKRRGHHSVPQRSTNAVLVELARRHRCVVRLKGGDPFLFGRGGEEAAHLAAAGIPVQVVPGVTSGIAAPAYAGVPVTHRAADKIDHQPGAVAPRKRLVHRASRTRLRTDKSVRRIGINSFPVCRMRRAAIAGIRPWLDLPARAALASAKANAAVKPRGPARLIDVCPGLRRSGGPRRRGQRPATKTPHASGELCRSGGHFLSCERPLSDDRGE